MINLDFPSPLRLAVGNHRRGSGKGCVMNVISYENGDREITDLPSCADPMLAKIAQKLNDTYCSHRDEDLLCPSCSMTVIEFGHRLVGTSSHGLSFSELHRVWVRVAARVAREVLHLAGEAEPQARAAIEAAEGWVAGAVTAAAAADAAYAADAASANAADAASAASAAYAADAASAYAADAASANAASAASAASAAYAAYAAFAANATSATHAAYVAAAASASAADDRLRFANLAVDEFYRLTGLGEKPTEPAVVAAAYAEMVK